MSGSKYLVRVHESLGREQQNHLSLKMSMID